MKGSMIMKTNQFRAADILMAERLSEQNLTYENPNKVIPMPNVQQTQQEVWEKAQRLAEIEMIQLITRKEMLKKKLGELDISKAKDAKKIASINIDLMNVDLQIKQLEMQYGISSSEIDQGTRVGRFLGKIKKGFKKIVKKAKKFYKRNFELIYGLAAIFVPVIGGFLLRKILMR